MLAALAAPDKFRGSLTAFEAAAAMTEGLRRAGWSAASVPLADGGEGTLDIVLGARGGRRIAERVTGPDGRLVTAEWALLDDGTAVIEMARASGQFLRRPVSSVMDAGTTGTGELIAAAAGRSERIVVTTGGSGTCDGGRGALNRLAWRLPRVPVLVTYDVRADYLDALEFAPQKGATTSQLPELERRLHRLADALVATGHRDPRTIEGAGAAGGLAGALWALGADLCPGFDWVADAVGYPTRAAGADLIVTGEGYFDRQSLRGKVVGGVVALLRPDQRCLIVAGDADDVPLPPNVERVTLSSLADGGVDTFSNAFELTVRAVAEHSDRTRPPG